MPTITSVITGAELFGDGPLTPAQRFHRQYATAVSAKNLSDEKTPFYAKDAIFHNQNGVDYSGDQIWPWIVQLFGQFERLSHDILKLSEIHNEDGTIDLVTQAIRHIWAPSNKSDEPTVSVPMSIIFKLSYNNAPDTVEGIQFKEAWLYWDTYKLLPYFSQDSVVFRSSVVLSE